MMNTGAARYAPTNSIQFRFSLILIAGDVLAGDNLNPVVGLTLPDDSITLCNVTSESALGYQVTVPDRPSVIANDTAAQTVSIGASEIEVGEFNNQRGVYWLVAESAFVEVTEHRYTLNITQAMVDSGIAIEATLFAADNMTQLSANGIPAEAQRRVYHADWLGELYMRAMVFESGEDFLEHGWQENINQLEKVEAALSRRDINSDLCEIIGAGWIAEEAFATALYCFLLFPDDPAEAMRRAANSSGDSDSIACIVGAFAEAYCGIDQLPHDWVERIE